MKRRLIRGAILLIVIAVLAGVAVRFLVPRNKGRIEDWIGSQLQTVANSYLNPKLSFTDLTYEYPRGVSLNHFRLTADDPAHPGKTIDIIAADHAMVSLAEIPSFGKPIVIEKIELDQPSISAVAVAPMSQKFVGFSDLLRAPSTAATADEKNPRPARKTSDVFRIRLVQITDGKIVYDPRIPGTAPMMLDKINTSLHIEPGDGAWYKLDTAITRAPVLDLQLRGLINLDTLAGRDLTVKLLADLGQDKLNYLPPELQSVLKKYDARGKLSIEMAGSLPVMDPLKGQGTATLKLDGANLAMNGLHIPVEHVELNSRFDKGTVTVPSLKIAALGGSVDFSGSAKLNDRLDTELHLKIAGVKPETLLANASQASGADPRLDAEFDFAGALSCLFGQIQAQAGEPLASIGLRNLRLSANDPADSKQTIDLLACKNLNVSMTEPILPGKPLVIDQIVLDQPLISAIAVAPGSSRFIGVPRWADESAPSASTSPATTDPAARLSDILRVKTLQLKQAKVIYDPRTPGTDRLVLDHVNATAHYCQPTTGSSVAAKSTAGPVGPDSYDVDLSVASNADADLQVAGRIDLQTLVANPLKVNTSFVFGGKFSRCLPASWQAALTPYNPAGSITISGTGNMPFLNPAAFSADVDVKLDHVQATAGNYRIPIDRANVPLRIKPGQIEFLDPGAGGGPTVQALGGAAKIVGVVKLNKRLDSTLTIGIYRMLLQALMADQIAGPKKNLAGEIRGNVQLVDAPLRAVIASAMASSSQLAAGSLPAKWGSADIQMTHARFTGFAMVQGMTNLARSAFAALFKAADHPAADNAPTESGSVAATFEKDHIAISNLHYEGEDLGADGKGYLTLGGELNMDITGGPMSKLSNLGTVGSWIEHAGDSLLYYHVSGPLQNPKVEARSGDGHPIVQGAKDLAGKGAKAVGDGLDKAGSIINGLFNHDGKK
ncbi:MAG TPA: hypothetical protein VFE47_26185 [Tepidisphaeraceae bacterium]|jgi:hypothetical protein|nr:hypothetical protein [Tepidisphaeraceae bacterium]